MKSYIAIFALGFSFFILIASISPVELGGVLAPIATGAIIAVLGATLSTSFRSIGLLAAIIGTLAPSMFIIKSFLYAERETLVMFSKLGFMAISPILYHVIITVIVALAAFNIMKNLRETKAN